MTQEEKAEAYSKAVEKAKQEYSITTSEDRKQWLEELFPELRESEDERIRKEILNYIDKATGCKRWVAWLEKQGKKELENYDEAEKEKADFVGDGFIECHADFLDFKEGETYWLEYIGDDKYNVRSDNILGKTYHITPCQLYTVFKKLTWLEYGEKNLTDKVEPTDYNSIDPHFGKPTDKVEPKFKVGDWCIDNEDGTIFQIVKVLDNTYRYRTNEGKEYSCTHYSLELDARYWNISDAKDGDVLVDSLGNVCIYQEPSTKLMYHSHCYVNHKDFLYMGGSHEIVGSYPATKEQCDQLGKVMADAGYEFDFEKKELNEFGEYDGDDYGIDSLWHARRILKKTLGKVDGYQSDDGILEHKCAISAVDKLYKQKPSWSAEETFMVQRICKYLDAAKKYYVDSSEVRECIDWLKSLEERVLPRQKQ